MGFTLQDLKTELERLKNESRPGVWRDKALPDLLRRIAELPAAERSEGKKLVGRSITSVRKRWSADLEASAPGAKKAAREGLEWLVEDSTFASQSIEAHRVLTAEKAGYRKEKQAEPIPRILQEAEKTTSLVSSRYPNLLKDLDELWKAGDRRAEARATAGVLSGMLSRLLSESKEREYQEKRLLKIVDLGRELEAREYFGEIYERGLRDQFEEVGLRLQVCQTQSRFDELRSELMIALRKGRDPEAAGEIFNRIKELGLVKDRDSNLEELRKTLNRLREVTESCHRNLESMAALRAGFKPEEASERVEDYLKAFTAAWKSRDRISVALDREVKKELKQYAAVWTKQALKWVVDSEAGTNAGETGEDEGTGEFISSSELNSLAQRIKRADGLSRAIPGFRAGLKELLSGDDRPSEKLSRSPKVPRDDGHGPIRMVLKDLAALREKLIKVGDSARESLKKVVDKGLQDFLTAGNPEQLAAMAGYCKKLQHRLGLSNGQAGSLIRMVDELSRIHLEQEYLTSPADAGELKPDRKSEGEFREWDLGRIILDNLESVIASAKDLEKAENIIFGYVSDEKVDLDDAGLILDALDLPTERMSNKHRALMAELHSRRAEEALEESDFGSAEFYLKMLEPYESHQDRRDDLGSRIETYRRGKEYLDDLKETEIAPDGFQARLDHLEDLSRVCQGHGVKAGKERMGFGRKSRVEAKKEFNTRGNGVSAGLDNSVVDLMTTYRGYSRDYATDEIEKKTRELFDLQESISRLKSLKQTCWERQEESGKTDLLIKDAEKTRVSLAIIGALVDQDLARAEEEYGAAVQEGLVGPEDATARKWAYWLEFVKALQEFQTESRSEPLLKAVQDSFYGSPEGCQLRSKELQEFGAYLLAQGELDRIDKKRLEDAGFGVFLLAWEALKSDKAADYDRLAESLKADDPDRAPLQEKVVQIIFGTNGISRGADLLPQLYLWEGLDGRFREKAGGPPKKDLLDTHLEEAPDQCHQGLKGVRGDLETGPGRPDEELISRVKEAAAFYQRLKEFFPLVHQDRFPTNPNLRPEIVISDIQRLQKTWDEVLEAEKEDRWINEPELVDVLKRKLRRYSEGYGAYGILSHKVGEMSRKKSRLANKKNELMRALKGEDFPGCSALWKELADLAKENDRYLKSRAKELKRDEKLSRWVKHHRGAPNSGREVTAMFSEIVENERQVNSFIVDFRSTMSDKDSTRLKARVDQVGKIQGRNARQRARQELTDIRETYFPSVVVELLTARKEGLEPILSDRAAKILKEKVTGHGDWVLLNKVWKEFLSSGAVADE